MADQLTVADWVQANRRDVVGFSRYLRTHGFTVSILDTVEATKTLAEQTLADPLSTMVLWRVIYAKAPEQWQRFELLFNRYFGLGGARFKQTEASVFEPDDTGSGDSFTSQRTMVAEVSARKPLLAYSPHWGAHYPLHPDPGIDYGRLRQTTRLMLKHWEDPRGFHRQHRFGADWDWRRIMSDSLRRGGEMVEWSTWGSRPEPPRIVVLVDVSGSMRPYAPFYLALAWQLVRSGARAEVFVASTHLKRVTARLRNSGPLGPEVIDSREIGGGTRLGWAFSQLWQQYRPYLTRRTIFLMASDGFDTGESWRIAQYFPQISYAVRMICWLNPLLLEPDYSPQSSALNTALPFCQIHAGVRDERSWQRLVTICVSSQANRHELRDFREISALGYPTFASQHFPLRG